MKRKTAFCSLSAGCLLAGATCCAQVSTAAVSGVVEDLTGGRLPSARVRLVNLQNGTVNAADSGADGAFLVPAVLPGNYSLQISHDGFATLRLLGLTLSIGESRQFRVVLQVRSEAQTVDVVTEDAASRMQGSEISTVVAQGLVNNLPLAGRSFQDLVAMTPGAVLQSPQVARAGEFSINGQPTDTNVYLVDGVSANFAPGPLDTAIKSPAAGQYAPLTTLGTTQGILALDALQEFRVIASTAQPEYGRATGGQFSLLSQQGKDSIHATAYSALRNGYFDAQDRFGSNLNYYHQQDVGGTLTAPLDFWRKPGGRARTLLFGTYEELHVEQRAPVLDLYSPSYNLYSAAPPAVQSALLAFPTSTLSGLNDVGSPASFLRSMDIRLDRTLYERFHLFTRFGQHPSGSDAEYLNTETQINAKSLSVTTGLDAQFNGHFGSELRLGWGVGKAKSESTNVRVPNRGPLVQNDIAKSFGIDTPYASTRSELFLHIDGTGQASAFSDGAYGRVRQLQLRDTFSWQRASHLVRFGLDLRGLHSDIVPREYSIETDYVGADSVVNNRATDAVFRRSLPAYPVFHQYAAFLQDAWQIQSRVSISYGLRWDVAPAPSASDGRLPFLLQSSPANAGDLSFRTKNSQLWHTDWTNVGPRAGASWQVNDHRGREFVLHAGAGVLFDNAHRAAAEMFRSAGFVATRIATQASLPLPTSFPSTVTAAGFPDTGSIGYLVPDTVRSPWALQWNILAEQAIGQRQTFSASFVGSSGHALLLPMRHLSLQGNAPTAAYVTFPTGYTDAYRSLQVQWRGSAPHLSWAVSYVLSRTLDTKSIQPYAAPSYASADTDVRHNLQNALAWDLPHAHMGTILRRATEGWGLDARHFVRSAYPITPVGRLLIDPVTGERFNSNVDFDSNQPLYMNNLNLPGGRVLNGGPTYPSGAFRLPALGAVGTAPRNVARGFGAQQLSLSLRRDIALISKVTLQLRGDVFNVTNTPDYGYIDPQLTDPLFGRPLLSLNQSYGQTSSLYQPGGPRSLQWTFRVRW